jgi:hypothetical protein
LVDVAAAELVLAHHEVDASKLAVAAEGLHALRDLGRVEAAAALRAQKVDVDLLRLDRDVLGPSGPRGRVARALRELHDNERRRALARTAAARRGIGAGAAVRRPLDRAAPEGSARSRTHSHTPSAGDVPRLGGPHASRESRVHARVKERALLVLAREHERVDGVLEGDRNPVRRGGERRLLLARVGPELERIAHRQREQVEEERRRLVVCGQPAALLNAQLVLIPLVIE